MVRVSRVSTKRKVATVGGVAAILAGILIVGTHVSNAGESCQGLDTALQNNLNFIADQQRNPDALSSARIANRQAVVDLIQQRRKAAGCTANVQPPAAQPPAARPPANQPPANRPPAGQPPVGKGVVCKGSTVTLSGEGGVPAA